MPNKKHVVQSGDTFDSLSTRYFGEPSQAGRIQSANPGTTVTLVPGTVVTIPAAPGSAVGSEGPGLVMRIDGTSFRHITDFTLTSRLTGVDTVDIVAPLAETEQFSDLVTPLSFRSLDVADSGDLLFRGTMTSVIPSLTNEGSSVVISGYSLPGVLTDCMAPASSYPLQFRNLGLADIASQLADPFSLDVSVQGDMGGPFKRVKLKRDQRIMPFLIELAHQRQVLIRSNPQGQLVLAGPTELSAEVATLTQSTPPVTSITPSFNAQGYYSHVTCVRSVRRGNAGSQHTVVNPLASGIVRPITLSIQDTSEGELPAATLAAMGRMLSKAVVYAVGVSTHFDPAGARWTPGSTISLHAPSVFVKDPYKFQIHTVTLKRSAKNLDTAELLLMLPGAFGGAPPSVLPWD